MIVLLISSSREKAKALALLFKNPLTNGLVLTLVVRELQVVVHERVDVADHLAVHVLELRDAVLLAAEAEREVVWNMEDNHK